MTAPILVLAAQPAEIAAFGRSKGAVEKGRIGQFSFCRVGLAGCEVVAAATGEGRDLARAGAEVLVEALRPSLVVAVGLAGGLSPTLSRGDLLVSSRVVSETGESLTARPVFQRSAEACGAALGVVLTVDRIVGEPADKRALWREIGSPEHAVVDMESFDFASSAADRGLPFVVLRVVSDAVDEAVPSWLNRCRRGDGSISRLRVAARMLLHPGDATALLRMRGLSEAASKTLLDGLEALLSEGSTEPPPS